VERVFLAKVLGCDVDAQFQVTDGIGLAHHGLRVGLRRLE